MAEFDRVRTLVTGRQSAHLQVVCGSRRQTDGERREPLEFSPSVVEWEVREEVCQPYRIRALISSATPLPRADILGQLARFSFHTEEGADVRKFRGFVSRFGSVSRSPDGYTYRVEIRQRLAQLDGPSNCATYQEKSSAEIIQEVMERYEKHFSMRIELRLRRQHPKHPFRFQYNMGDWAWCRLLMEQEGLFTFTTMDEHGEILVIADDIDAYERPAIGLKDRPSSGMLTFEESIFDLKFKARTIPQSFIVADYKPENRAHIFREEGQARDEFGTQGEDETMLGTPMVWGTHHDDEAGAKREATLRHEAARAQQIICKAKSTMPSIRPGCVVKPDTLERLQSEGLNSREGLVVWKVVHRGARNQNYHNTFRAIPSNRPYRLPIDESKWPRVQTLGFTVTSPDGYKYPYLDAEGRIVVRFHCDFGNWPKGAESIPLRMAKPFASRDHSGLNMPPVDGDEGVAGFHEQNPNKPFAMAFLPNARNPDLINSSRRRLSRSEIRTRAGNKLWFDDFHNAEGIELSTEHSGRSQLNLGHIPDGELKPRGEGVELRTDDRLVARGGKGVMVTAYNQAGGGGKVLAMEEASAQFADHQTFASTLAQSAEASKASPADLNAQKGINAGLNELKRPGVLMTGPGPVGIASGDGVQLAADGSLIGTAKKGIHFTTLRRFTVAASDLLSLFTQKGLSLITAAGDFVAQAQRGRMQLASQEDMTVESVGGVVHVKAAKEIILNVDGTYVKLTGEGVEIGSRGGVLYRTAGVKGIGPAQMNLGGAAFAPKFVPYTTGCEVWRNNPNFVPSLTPAEALGVTDAPAHAPAFDAASMASVGGNSTQSLELLGRALPGATESAGATGKYSPFDGKPANVDSRIPKIKVTLNSTDDQQQTYVAPDPIKLATAIPCDWKSTDLSANVSMHIESRSYWAMKNDRTKWIDPGTNMQLRGGGSRDSKFELAYSEKDKTITSTVRVMLIPMDLFPVDSNGVRDTSVSGDDASIPYDSYPHWQMTPGKVSRGIKMDYRDAVGDKYNVAALMQRIEAVLNQGNYKLILDGCSKGAACGCRVKVKFKVDFRVSIKGAPIAGFTPHVSLNLFPSALRADTEAWGEKYKYKQNQKIIDYPDANVEAHECGHYFNFPDEYYDQGGWLHESYIKDEQIDFLLVDAKAGMQVWQAHSANNPQGVGGNLMGDGCNNPLQGGRITASIKPYYLEYVRRQFSIATGKLWRIGYEV